MFNLFKGGDAKQIKKSVVDGTQIEDAVKKYAVGTTKSGGEAKNYTLLDVMAILREIETKIKSAGMEDLSDILKIRNYQEIMGDNNYVTGKEEDRTKLIVQKIFEATRRKDGVRFGYNVIARSIGSGIETRYTIFNRVFEKEPIKPGDLIYLANGRKDVEKQLSKDGKQAYWTILRYQKLI